MSKPISLSSGDKSVITVLVADDHELMLEGLAALVATMPSCEVVGTAHDGYEVVILARELKPRVVLMDVRMPGLSGAEAAAQIVSMRPETAVVMVTMFADDQSVFHALRAGASGYVLKGATKAELERAVTAAANGEAHFGHEVVSRFSHYFAAPLDAAAAQPFPELTKREREVLALLAQGLTNLEISRHLQVTAKTARNHVSNVLGKLGATDRRDAAQRAREAGFAQTDTQHQLISP